MCSSPERFITRFKSSGFGFLFKFQRCHRDFIPQNRAKNVKKINVLFRRCMSFPYSRHDEKILIMFLQSLAWFSARLEIGESIF